MMRLTVLLLWALAGCVRVPDPPPLTGPVVGYTARTWRDPVSGGFMRAVLFFPPLRPLQQNLTRLGPWWVEAQSTESIGFGKHPVVFISHASGEAGSRFAHHDLAVALARAGYLVCALEHPGDNYADQTSARTEKVYLGRAWQVSAAIDALLADPLFGPRIDPARLGVAGFSEGGYTSLLLIGARPDFTRWESYCARTPGDLQLCREKPPALTVAKEKPTKDARVRAAFVMAPLGIFFGPDSFGAVRTPVSLAVAQNDSVLIPSENVAVLREGMSTIFDFTQVPGVDHFFFLAPCGGDPKLCADPPGIDRRLLHEQLNTAAVKFFEAQLH